MISLTLPKQWHQCAEKFILQENYILAANIYEQAIDAEPSVKSYYWYLGLMLLLQGQEVEAQTTWFMAMLEAEPEQVEIWNSELAEILATEAERQEALEKYSNTWRIRQQIKEISPTDINNLLCLLQIAIKLDIYTEEILINLKVIEILEIGTLVTVNIELLMQVLRNILIYAPFDSFSLKLAEVCLPYVKNNANIFLNAILPPAVDIAYTTKRPEIAARLGEIYLKLDANNTEMLGHLACFYSNADEFDRGIEVAKRLYSLADGLIQKIHANRQVLRALMTAGGYWEESKSVAKTHEELLLSLIENPPETISQINILRLYNSNYFAPYLEDAPREFRLLQNQLLSISYTHTKIYAQEQLEKYSQGHSQRKQNISSTKKIKIGYISYCLRRHSVGWLARWLFQHHDRNKFQINAYFVITNPTDDSLHEWYVSQVDKAYNSNNVFNIAEQIYQDEIDILIDLDSITLDLTCEIVALKPAPIQVTWLGWDASGSPSIDYYIADPYVLPESAQEYYREKIWRLPQTYIAVDGFEVGIPDLRRELLDIPSDAIVFLSAQRGFKRHPQTTRLQMKIIREVPNSYFLIKGIADEESIKDLFYQVAEEEGVDCSRLRFLPGVSFEAVHRANLGIADVVLDTYPYNGATTTLETLWMGIPLVTRVGEQFAARNSYTMMMNAGITEGIAWTDNEYIEWGVRLGKDEALRQQIAWKLRKSRQTAPLWNGKQFTREMENAYEQMWQKYIEES